MDNKNRYQWDLEKLSPREYYRYRQTGIYPLKPGILKNRTSGALPRPPRFSAFCFREGSEKRQRVMHCLRETAAAIGSLLSTALPSATGKQLHLSISGEIFTP